MYYRTNENANEAATRRQAGARAPGRSSGRLGERGTPIDPPKSIVSLVIGEDVPLRRFECSADALARIQAVTGHVMTQAEVLDSVRFQAGNAAGVAAKVATRLQSTDSILVSTFQSTLGVSLTSGPSWRPTGGWSHGQIVRQRFLGAHRLLKSGALLYSCWGRPRGAGGLEANPNYLALARPGQYWIGLGRQYWEAVRNGDVDTTTHAFLFAALRAYYGPQLSDATALQAPSVPPFSNIHCYIKFVANLLNAKLPTWVEDNCAPSV